MMPIYSFAQQTTNDFEIIPEATSGGKVTTAVDAVGQTGGNVWKAYNENAAALSGSVGDQIASGIMTRDTLLDYVVYLVRFLSQIGIFIGVVMIIYAGYLYASSIFES
jgi:hypothetical protein